MEEEVDEGAADAALGDEEAGGVVLVGETGETGDD